MQVRVHVYSFHILGNARGGDILSRARRCKVKVANHYYIKISVEWKGSHEKKSTRLRGRQLDVSLVKVSNFNLTAGKPQKWRISPLAQIV
jgi:hypothetical protein